VGTGVFFMLSKAGFVCMIGKFVVREEGVCCRAIGSLGRAEVMGSCGTTLHWFGLMFEVKILDSFGLPSSGSGYLLMHQACGCKLVSALEIALQPSVRTVMRTVVENRNSSEVCCVKTSHLLGDRHF
jgi:hypothetical protein